jgi:hypothetical protein
MIRMFRAIRMLRAIRMFRPFNESVLSKQRNFIRNMRIKVSALSHSQDKSQ